MLEPADLVFEVRAFDFRSLGLPVSDFKLRQVAFKEAGEFGFWAMMIFLGILTVGFIYEWKKGALEWD